MLNVQYCNVQGLLYKEIMYKDILSVITVKEKQHSHLSRIKRSTAQVLTACVQAHYQMECILKGYECIKLHS